MISVEGLINLLKNYPPEMKVIVDGYESGYTEVKEIKQVRVFTQDPVEYYAGEYDDYEGSGQFFDALLISRQEEVLNMG